jgi:hypothetical protein
MVERQEPEIQGVADGWRRSHDLTVALVGGRANRR